MTGMIVQEDHMVFQPHARPGQCFYSKTLILSQGSGLGRLLVLVVY